MGRKGNNFGVRVGVDDHANGHVGGAVHNRVFQLVLEMRNLLGRPSSEKKKKKQRAENGSSGTNQGAGDVEAGHALQGKPGDKVHVIS